MNCLCLQRSGVVNKGQEGTARAVGKIEINSTLDIVRKGLQTPCRTWVGRREACLLRLDMTPPRRGDEDMKTNGAVKVLEIGLQKDHNSNVYSFLLS